MTANMRILCVGASHRTAPVALRELLAFDAGQARSALTSLSGQYPDGEFMLLSTCNRCELYALGPRHGRPNPEELRAFLGQFHHLPWEQYEPALYALSDAEAVRHLFSVAAGLDSLVPGEDQILNQLKAAHRLARSLSAARAGLDELLGFACNVAKHARSQTNIAAGKVSVASVACELAQDYCGELGDKCLLSVGAGKMNTLMLRQLKLGGVGGILVANRSPQRAAELAGACAGLAVSFDELPEALARADVAVCSTGSNEPVVSAQAVRAAMAKRPARRLLIVDIAVPRDVEAAAGQIPNVRLYNIDDLKAVVDKNVALRGFEIDACALIVDQHVREFFHRLHVRQVAPAIEDLYQQMRAIADEEIAGVKFRLTGAPDADEQVMRHAFHRALRRILHVPMSSLREAAGTDSARQQAAMLIRLFGLNGAKPDPPPAETENIEHRTRNVEPQK